MYVSCLTKSCASFPEVGGISLAVANANTLVPAPRWLCENGAHCVGMPQVASNKTTDLRYGNRNARHYETDLVHDLMRLGISESCIENYLVLAFSVVGHKTCARCRDEQVVKPVFVIDETIELVGRRDGPFPNLGSGTIGHEVVKEHPGSNLQFGRTPVAMEVT